MERAETMTQGELLPPPEMRALCRVDDVPDGQGKGFPATPGGFTGIFAVRQGDAVRVWVNACPHVGTPLDWTPDKFMSRDGRHIVCATHGALFSPETGECVQGPCRGDYIDAVAAEIRDGVVYVPADAGL
jgi:nitrite reductase/ring-hydroxylating ferredoxin subunit